MGIKEPSFDKPLGLGATSEVRPVDPTTVEVIVGMRVVAKYQGKIMTAEITDVTEPNVMFVARVLGFENHETEHGDLKHGDLIRITHDDLSWLG